MAEKKSVKEEIRSVLTVKTIAMGVIASIVSTIIVVFILNGIPVGVQDKTFELSWVTGAFFFLFLIMLIHRIWSFAAPKLRLSQQQSVTIYSMLILSSAFAVIPYFLIPWFSFLVQSDTYRAGVLGGGGYMPNLWVPNSKSIVDGAFYGGTVVPWSNWLSPVIYWIVLFGCLGLCQMFINIVWRKQFVEVERLPFPYADAATEIMRAGNASGMEKAGRIWKAGPFWWGALVGFLFMLYPVLTALHNLIPWFPAMGDLPEVYNWWIWGYDATSIIRNNTVLRINLNPLWIALAFLIPLDTLLSAWLWFFICYVILPPIQVAIGTYPSFPEQNDGSNYIWANHWAGKGFMPGWVMWGVMLGLPLWMLLFNRGYIVGTIRKAFGKAEGNPDGEKGLYRMAYIGAIITFAIVAGLLIYAGLPVLAGILIPAWALLIYWAWTRVRSIGGGYTDYWWYGPWYQDPAAAIVWIPFSVSGTYNSAASFRTTAISMMLMEDRSLGAIPQPASMESFKLADRAGIRPRELVLPQAIAIIIGVVIAFPLTIWGAYRWGWDKQWIGGPNRGGWSTWFQAFIRDGGNVLVPVDWSSWLGQFIFGGFFCGLLIFLRMRFVWWPIEPIGIILGSSAVTGWFMFTALVVAWVIKMLVLKIGGTSLYEKTALPFSSGLFVGAFLMLYILKLGSP